MSTPVRGTESDDKFLQYAPRWIREGAPGRPPSTPGRTPTPTRAVADAPPMAPGIGAAKIEASPLPPRFEGDIAMEALRRRMALEPQRVPEPPIRLRRPSRMAWIGRLSAMCMVAGLGAFGLTWLTAKPPVKVAQEHDREVVAPAVPVGIKSARAAPARLLVESQRGDVNEPLPLGIALDGRAGGEKLLVAGFADGTRLTAGVSLGRAGWLLSALDLGKAMAYAPQDFVGAMDARVDLRAANDQMLDSQIVRLEWVAKQPEARMVAIPPAMPSPGEAAPQPLAADEIAGLVKRGQDLLRTGDIASARLLLRRAANAGSASAALAMGGTFDGAVLAQLGVVGFAANADQARFWYRKAAEFGSAEADKRLQSLASAGN